MTRIWVVMRDMESVWLITPTFFPCEDWSMARELMTVSRLSWSRVPKPSSMKRFTKEMFMDDRAERSKAKPRETMQVSPQERDGVART